MHCSISLQPKKHVLDGQYFSTNAIIDTCMKIFETCDRFPGFGGTSALKKGDQFDVRWTVTIQGRFIFAGFDGGDGGGCGGDGNVTAAVAS